MKNIDFVVLYVESAAVSANFYAALLGKEPAESSPTFAMFAFESGLGLGLWSRQAVDPAVVAAGSGVELNFSVADNATVDAMYADWRGRGISIAQVPTTHVGCGYTFVALDPDGHRLRVFAMLKEHIEKPIPV